MQENKEVYTGLPLPLPLSSAASPNGHTRQQPPSPLIPVVPDSPPSGNFTLTPPTPAVPDRIVLTGFQPFGGFEKTNPSWTAASALHGRVLSYGNKRAVIESFELPVEYAAVDTLLPKLHARKPAPLFYLHLGASGQKPWHFLRLEIRGHGTGYKKPDNTSRAPSDGLCHVSPPFAPLHLDPSQIPAALPINNDLPTRVLARHPRGVSWQISLSPDAGHYLCDYTLFGSTLCAGGKTPVLFCHVPPVGKENQMSEAELIQGIDFLVQCLYELVMEDGQDTKTGQQGGKIALSGNIGLGSWKIDEEVVG